MQLSATTFPIGIQIIGLNQQLVFHGQAGL